jgi:hypothetical protein
MSIGNGSPVQHFDVAIMRDGNARIITCTVIPGYSTEEDIPKMISIRHGEGWQILGCLEVTKN